MSQHAAFTSEPIVPFGVRLRTAMDAHGPFCAGIDPHRGLVEGWGLPYDFAGVERFALTCVEAFGGVVAAVKPQSAFFEVFGSRGVALLERVLDELRSAGTLTILDAKRGDIGTTMDAYADAFLGKDSPSPADALTVSPYLGYGSLRPAIDLAAATEGPSVQHAVRDGRSVAGQIVDGAAADNAEAADLGHVGLVVGATVGTAVTDLQIDLAAAKAPLLAPGLGAQGATAEDLQTVFGAALPNVLANSSRGILSAGPDAGALRAAAVRESGTLSDVLGGA